jgi:hypothetical protein
MSGLGRLPSVRAYLRNAGLDLEAERAAAVRSDSRGPPRGPLLAACENAALRCATSSARASVVVLRGAAGSFVGSDINMRLP